MIDNRLLAAYITELEALRGHGGELAQAYPDIAARLDIGPRRSRDPGVERLIESAAFLSARLRMMMEDTAAELPMTLLAMLAPTLLDPVPSMTLAQLHGGTSAHAIPRGSRLDYEVAGQPMIGFTTTMPTMAAPFRLKLQRFKAPGMADGLSVKLIGQPPDRLIMCVGNNELSASVLMDALSEDLVAVHIVQPQGSRTRQTTISPTSLRFHGYGAEEAALPSRPATNDAHRIVTEYMAFPTKFNFISLEGVEFRHETEIRFLFGQPLQLPLDMPNDLITVNRVPVVNLWPTAGTPFDVTGREIEYPVKVDALRYPVAECHSVQDVEMHGDEGASRRIDPMMAYGNIDGTDVRWGWRRVATAEDNQVMLFFQGLDYQSLGRTRFLATPRLVASNNDMPQRIRTGSPLIPIDSLKDWEARVTAVPTPYRSALKGENAMRRLLGYLGCSMTALAETGRTNMLHEYLRQFPGGDEASWIEAIRSVAFRPVVAMRKGVPQNGVAGIIGFDPVRCPTASRGVVKRVLSRLFESQRGVNQLMETLVVTQ